MPAANNHFRTARERTASPTHPGVSLTRQELAESVNTWMREHHNKKVVVVTAHYIGRLETNVKSGTDRRYYTWDHTHNDIEVWDSNGNHQGSMDPGTGKMTKPAVPGRDIKDKTR